MEALISEAAERKAEIRKLHLARSDGNTIDAVREPLIRHKLAHVEERENTVRLLLCIYIAGLVASYHAFTIVIAHGEEVAGTLLYMEKGIFDGFAAKKE